MNSQITRVCAKIRSRRDAMTLTVMSAENLSALSDNLPSDWEIYMTLNEALCRAEYHSLTAFKTPNLP